MTREIKIGDRFYVELEVTEINENSERALMVCKGVGDDSVYLCSEEEIQYLVPKSELIDKIKLTEIKKENLKPEEMVKGRYYYVITNNDYKWYIQFDKISGHDIIASHTVDPDNRETKYNNKTFATKNCIDYIKEVTEYEAKGVWTKEQIEKECCASKCESKEMKGKVKPPIGVIPKNIRLEQRFVEVSEAIKRYEEANYSIPMEWINEVLEITVELLKLK